MTNKQISKLLEKTTKKHLGNIKLLITNKEFIDIIQDTRKYLNIPAEGFEEDKDISKWSNDYVEKSDEVLDSIAFRKEEFALKEQFRKERFKFKQRKFALDKLYDRVPIIFLQNRIAFIIDKFNLPLNYDKFLKSYIVVNRIVNVPCRNFMFSEYPPFVRPWEAKFLPIKIFARLTNEEIDFLKSEIAINTKRLPKYQVLKNIDRDLDIEEWMSNKERFDVVENKPYKITSSEIAEDLLGSGKKVKKVHDIVKDLKKTRNKRFKSSGKT